MGTLVLLRHGQSQWNLENRFTGWTDVPLTDRGRNDAQHCAESLKGYSFDVVFTSRLVRAIETLDIVLRTICQEHVHKVIDSALNERHYGDLQGLNKAETVFKHGKEQVQLWRRDFFTRPQNGESMEDCERRTWPFFTHYIFPYIRDEKTVLVVAHGNSMRPIMKNIEALEPKATAALELGLCTPYIYTFAEEKMVKKETLIIEGIVTKGASLKEKNVENGRI
jgi:2,3-bisphosphoglycerate-dependent phosphoglycerate mutase